MSCRVVNLNKSNYDVYIGRGSKWGNPFVIGVDGTRQEVIKKYQDWLFEQPELMISIGNLRDKTLGCFCKPKSCHGDILVELANQLLTSELL